MILGKGFEVLELIRAVISSLSLRNIGEVSRLEATYLSEHSGYLIARNEVHEFSEVSNPATIDATTTGTSSKERERKLQINLRAMEKDIRSLTGFEVFHCSPLFRR